MNWMPAFVSWPLAAAAALCAAGPLIIHLLNRRRFRTVQWAAMEYLLQAVKRNRRILRLRDLILLLLRTAAVLLCGLGLAQPYFAADRTAAYDGREPLHAVLLVDNSQSMGAQSLDGSLLDAAKRRGVELIRRLPAGSRITVAPLSGSDLGLSTSAFQSPEHAEEALERIPLVGRSAPASAALNLARQAWETETALSKRLVLLTDMQAVNWQGAGRWDEDKPVQIVDVRAGQVPNTWIEQVTVEDNLADVQTPAVIVVVVRHEGPQPREHLQVALEVDGVPVGVQTVDLPAGGRREVAFEHLFNRVAPEPGRPQEALLEASLPEDRLVHDDRRAHVAHVVASLPVVFVDPWGDREDVLRGQIGETRHVRQLLAPAAAEDSLIRIRHLRPDQLDRDALADARLTVVAGVERPGPWADLLLDYVRQGGQLVLAAGGDFQPEAWNELWQQGNHLLPLPLERELVGKLPSDAGGDLQPFFLDFDSVRNHDYFRIAGVPEDDLRDLYGEPLFFQAVATTDIPASSREETDGPPSEEGADDEPPGDESGSEGEQGRDSEQGAEGEQATRWVAWPSRGADPQATGRPRVLARLDRRQLPLVVERELGEGRVAWIATGLLAEWNTLPRTNAVLMLDRLMRAMLHSTLPQRNFPVQDRIAMPLPEGSQRLRWQLRRPGAGDQIETLEPGFLSSQVRGVTIERSLRPGAYLVEGLDAEQGTPVFRIPLVAEAPASESQLAAASGATLQRQLGPAVQWVGPSEAISLAGQQTRGQDLWWWLVLAALGLLLLELLVLAPRWSATRGAAGAGEAA